MRNAVALLVGTELWGFVSPMCIDLELVRNATSKVQPYYAVPSQYLAMDEFPTTRNGKVDKRALVGLAEGGNCIGQRRLSVPHGGVPFNPNLPGTPNAINEQPSFKWSPPTSRATLELPPDPRSSRMNDNSCLPSQREDKSSSVYVLEDVPRMVFVDAM